MFTTEHFVWLAICAVIISVLTFLSVKLKFSFRTSAFIMAGVALCSELSKILTHMEYVNGKDASEGMAIDPEALPFHLCSILIFAFFYLPFAKNEKLKNFILSFSFPISIIGSLLALLMATSGTDFTTPEVYQCFIYHSAMLWFALYLALTKQVYLGFKAWRTNIITLFSLAFIMIWVNGALSEYNTNFFYVVRPPVEGLPILNLNNGWYFYFGTVIVCGLVGVTLVHLPSMIKERRNK